MPAAGNGPRGGQRGGVLGGRGNSGEPRGAPGGGSELSCPEGSGARQLGPRPPGAVQRPRPGGGRPGLGPSGSHTGPRTWVLLRALHTGLEGEGGPAKAAVQRLVRDEGFGVGWGPGTAPASSVTPRNTPRPTREPDNVTFLAVQQPAPRTR